MAEQPTGEKILPPSARKLERLREEGTVSKSQDLNAAAVLTMALVALYLLGGTMFDTMRAATRYYIGESSTILVTAESMQGLSREMLGYLGTVMLPYGLILLVAGVVINITQIGVMIAPKALMPKWQRISPASGFKRIFSLRALVELAKSLAKLSIIGAVVYFTLANRWQEMQFLMFLTPEGITREVASLIMIIWLRVVLAMLAIGVIDLLYQRWQFGQDQRMTMKEARDETKEMEGDPLIRQRIRQLQRRMSQQRMMAEVPTADVVITNPVRFAIALRYDPDKMDAPIVVAKGQRLIAERIRAMAVDNDVPIVERPPLARTLFKNVEVGQSVPDTLFRAVAEVLAFVYQVDRRAEKIRERALASATT